jgi:hypothetical protein
VFNVLFSFLVSAFHPAVPSAVVLIQEDEVECIYVPADYSGPIVAIPATENLLSEE